MNKDATVVLLPSAQIYLRRVELAAELGVHPHTVDDWRRQGMPVEYWGPKRGTPRFPRAAALAWLRQTGRVVE